MRILRNVLLAGATVALAGALAYAADAPKVHVLTIPLPGGGVEEIRYTGDVAPKVTIRRGPDAPAAWNDRFGAQSPFATLDRIQAEMNREMAGIMQHPMVPPPRAAFAGPGTQVTIGALPPGAQSYSMVSTFSGGHQCTQSVEVTAQGPGQAPKVVRQSSGDCGVVKGAPAAPAAPSATAIPPGPRTAI